MKRYIHVEYCRSISELTTFLEKLQPEQIISITEKNGYTVVWYSDKEYSWQ